MDVVKKFKKERWTKYIFAIMFTILFLFKPSFEGSIDNTSLRLYVIIFFVATLVYLLSQKNKNWFRLDILFLLGFSIVHFQWAIMMSMSDQIPLVILMGFIDSSHVNYATWLSVVGILAWFIGYSIPKRKSKKHIISYQFYYKKFFWLTIVLFILFVLMAGKDYLGGAVYKGEGAGGVATGIGVYFQILSGVSILILTTIVVLSSKYTSKSKPLIWFLNLDKKYLIFLTVYVLLFLSIGDRGGALTVIMTFLFLFGTFVRPISFKQFAIIIVIGAILMTLIGLGRSEVTGENIVLAGANKIEFESGYDTTMELSNSMNTLYRSLSNVPEYHDYFFGQLWLGNLLSSVPFLQNAYQGLTGINRYEMGSAQYITYLHYGLNPRSGDGTTLIADIYLNFGLIGVIFFMFLLGLFLKKVQNKLNQESFYWIVIAALLASIAFYMGRSGLFTGVRPILWGLIITVLFIKRKRIAQ